MRTGTHQNERGMPLLLSAHNFGVSPIEVVYALEKLRPKAKWPQKMRSNPSTSFFEFHQEQGHKIEDCIALRQEVVNMLRQGHLKELLSDRGRTNFSRGCKQLQGPPITPSPTRTVHMIIGGGGDTSINSVKLTITQKLTSINHEWYDELEESIIFAKSDIDGLVFPYYDAVVTNFRYRCETYYGSNACIICRRVIAQMKLEDNIVSCCIIVGVLTM
uniref:Uncharacterized protein n=1 Tax=Nicotiana tabacum TaxID=4097 RepID=A0A1S4DBZ9_TOBAC|nr:PREDICTED: uncharacterized protein LOC107828177 [Nicotiana tabacum]